MKNYSLRILAIFVVTLFACSSLFAQTRDNRWNIGLHTNFTEYQGDLGNAFMSFEDIDPGVSLSLGYYLSPTFDLTGKFGWSHVDYQDQDGTYAAGTNGYADLIGKYNDEGWKFYGALWNASANLKMKLNNGWLFNENAAIGPFIIGGVGMTRFEQTSVRDFVSEKTYSNLALYYGGGFNFRLSERLNMIVEAGIYNPMTDVYDGVTTSSAPGWTPDKNSVDGDVGRSNDEFLQYSLGFTYNLGKKKDADGDGVSDRKDKCPNTPSGVAVDEEGCPIDTDGDGVADYLDKCPNEPGTAEGCPDKDEDGVADKDDACPDVKGIKELDGCPDADGDGVADAKDECPETPSGVAVDSKGCPVDTDGDGVADYLDKCPNEAGVAANNGCPEVATDSESYFDRVVHFDFGKSYIRKVDIAILNEVIAKMQEDETLTANVAGHTDWIASDAFNQKLSERRARAVKKYLVSKGIEEARVTTIGYGEKSPIDTNETSAGRANNRRAEIRIKLQ